MVIRFYENQDPFEPKAPQNLSVRSLENDTTYFYYRFSQDSIAIPLKTDNDVTDFVFTLNTPAPPVEGEDPETTGNSDTLSFSYGREEEYINRACAFKINYVALKTSIEPEPDGETWIKDIRIEQANIENENQAHVSIFF
ncbi:hypothetical protein LPB144_02610 [Christiangramia salexigens]|uniref:Uncharacterized protein n=1 Tax=Christiangramia salexigens TaxID=1913577 RepID=A0A1L3J2L4_9FLAO|nr:hypothetical protein LPB144_02610 [Christiangramia salexigens]